MKINLAKSAGFCFGVKRAIEIALKAAASRKNVYMLGDIVHNEDVVRQLKQAGIRKSKKLSQGKNKTLLIRAHGIDRASIKKAKKLRYKIIDATCPMVKEIHRIAQSMEEKNYKIIIIGDKNHVEVRGILGQLKSKALLIENLKTLSLRPVRKITKACIVVQSTQNLKEVKKIVSRLRKHIKDLKFFNTVCQTTRMKQKEINKISRENEVMVIIGSKKSANTKRLFEISRSLNKRSYWVNSWRDLKRAWFTKAKKVGITAGASTPDYRIKEVINYIKQI